MQVEKWVGNDPIDGCVLAQSTRSDHVMFQQQVGNHVYSFTFYDAKTGNLKRPSVDAIKLLVERYMKQLKIGAK